MSDYHGFLRSRRSIRRFETRAVDLATLNRILETATYAPSAHNRQPWRFAVITTDSIRQQLSASLAMIFRQDLIKDGLPENEINSRVNRSITRINSSPAVIILCVDMSEMDIYPESGYRYKAERTMAIQSVAAAGLQLLLAARAEGLDGVWTCPPLFAPEMIQKTLDLPPFWEPQAMILLGYAAESPRLKVLKPLSNVIKYIN